MHRNEQVHNVCCGPVHYTISDILQDPLCIETGKGESGQSVKEDGRNVGEGEGKLEVILRVDLAVSKPPCNPGLCDAGAYVDGRCRYREYCKKEGDGEMPYVGDDSESCSSA